ncbi:WXG100-like domain-containing protein [Streptomyces kronopolitis]|uniref:WXG100-like domain-containing protein n=1 Tax=Streptomyces kronopolitis TaxID=1612435 RepID=UPI0020BFC94F|nr:hypothetical protein [Streptomyces kronopolitis]MCL6300163.1 hypothetical protein [Streptomyces kronopolitis]
MSVTLPNEVDWILDLLGFQWPNVDEDKMRDAAEAWSSFAASVRTHQQDGNTASNAVRGANSGEAIEAFGDHWKKFGQDGYLDDAADAAEVLALVLQTVAAIVMLMKLAVVLQLLALAVELATAQAAAPVTLGASEAGAAAATATTRVMVRRIFQEAKQKIVQAIKDAVEKKVVRDAKEMAQELAKAVGMDAAKGIGQNVATQGVKGYFGAQDRFDWGAAGRAGLKPVIDIDDKGKWAPGEKVKDLGKTFTGVYHLGQGAGQVAQGDFAGGGKKIWDAEQETAEGVKNLHDVRYKDKEAAAEGEGDGGGEAGSSDGGSGASSDGGSGGASDGASGDSSSSADGSGGTASTAAPASGTASRSAAPATPPAPATESGRAEAERARNAFG